MTTTFETMKRIIVKDYELAPERLTPDTPLESIELDSLAVTELIFALEDEFNVTAKTNGQEMQTLGDIAAYVDRLIAERDAPAAGTAS
jgi:acyl carrier protein